MSDPPGSHPGSPSLVELDRAECERLLTTHDVGRLAVVADGRPHVVPVNYVVAQDGTVVFRTAPGSIVNEASLRSVAFEVDDIDRVSHTGWSVVMHGFGRDIADAIDTDSVRLRQLPLATWAPGDRQEWFKIVASEVTGRRLS